MFLLEETNKLKLSFSIFFFFTCKIFVEEKTDPEVVEDDEFYQQLLYLYFLPFERDGFLCHNKNQTKTRKVVDRGASKSLKIR